MLYDSLKQSVSDYKEIKKKQEKPGDSLLFRWKLATIGLSIVLIALIGVLSQQYKTYQELKSYDTDHSFLASIIEQSNQLNSLTNINNLMSGLSSTLSLQFNKAQLLLGAVRQIDLESIVLAINKHSRLLFLLSNSDGSSFGMYMKTEFYLPNLQTDMLIIDPPDVHDSTIFNLVQAHALEYNVQGQCPIYRYDANSQTLTIMESISFLLNSAQPSYSLLTPSCFGDYNWAQINFRLATGVQTIPNSPVSIPLSSFEIYELQIK